MDLWTSEDFPMQQGVFLEVRISHFLDTNLIEIRDYAENLFEDRRNLDLSDTVYSDAIGGGGWRFIASPNIFEQWMEESSALIIRIDNSLVCHWSSGGHGLGVGGRPYFCTKSTLIGLTHFIAVAKFAKFSAVKLEHHILFKNIRELRFLGLLDVIPKEGISTIVNINDNCDALRSIALDLSANLAECVTKVFMSVLNSIGVDADLRVVQEYCHEITRRIQNNDAGQSA